MKRQTIRERQQIKTELADSFDRWNKMSDEELLLLAQKSWPAITGPPDRGLLLKFLTMSILDRID